MRSESGGVRPPQRPVFPPALAADREQFLLRIRPLIDSGALRPESIESIDCYVNLVASQAAAQSLVSAADRGILFTRHVLDSLNPIDLFNAPGKTGSGPGGAIDVGSGAGFPGIPLAIAWPSTRVTLVESRERKAAFLERVVRDIPLPNVSVVCDRLESWADGYRGAMFDAAFIRAVGDLPRWLQWLGRVCRVGSRWVYYMGEDREPAAVVRDMEAEVVRGAFGGRLLTGLFTEPGPPVE